jgi:hypothetical protein
MISSRRKYVDLTAMILSIGITLSITLLTIGIVWSAIKNGGTAATLTENETQVLISAFGGIFGILGAYIGYQLGNGAKESNQVALPPDDLDDTQERWPKVE